MANYKNKFKAKKIRIDGMVFDSKREYDRYLYLLELEKQEKIKYLDRQVKFELLPKQKGERSISYLADFVYLENDILVVEDVKSKITIKQSDYIIKRKLIKYFWINDLQKLKSKFAYDFEFAVFQEII